MKFSFRSLLSVVSLALAVMLSVTVSAQTVRGTITGTITDPSGAVIPGATIVLTAPATGVVVTTTSNGAGVYRFDGVLVGDYTLKATAKGFTTSTANAIVTVGALVGRDFTLKIGEATTITVNDIPPDLQTEEAVHSTVVPSESLATLPIAGQSSQNLLLTAPGVSASKIGVGDSGIGAVNGARPRSNNFLIDGINNNDISVMGPQYSPTNNDALQEVSIQTTNFSAQYGRAGGAVIIQVTKSGSDKFHGTVAEVYKTHTFYASNQSQRVYYKAGVTTTLIPKFVENIPALTFGGPVVIPHLYNGHKKTFFFGAAQWDRYSSGGSTATFTVPTAAGYAVLDALKGTCPNVATYLGQLGSIRGINTSLATPVSIAVPTALAATTCTGTDRSGMGVELGTYARSVPELGKDANHLVRIDHVISPKQNIMVRWMFDSYTDNVSGNIGFNSNFDVPFTSSYLTTNINHNYAITNQVANEFRFGFSRNNYTWFVTNALANSLPYVTPGSLSPLTLGTNFPQGRISNTWQFEDDITWMYGRHAFRFGAQVLRQLAVQQAPYNSRGTVTYAGNSAGTYVPSVITSLANFIDNVGGSGGSAAVNFGSGRYHPNLLTLSFYGQDTFKISPELTLNIGVRYENYGQPANGFKHPAFVSYTTDPNDGTKVDVNNFNFGPNVGISWAPTFLSKNHDFVIRAGYGISYDTFYNNMLSNMAAAAPNTLASQPITSTSTAATPRGYVGLASVLPNLVPVVLNPYSTLGSQFTKNMRNPYYNRLSFGIQKALPGSILLDVSYVGSLGRELFLSNYVNPIQPNSTYTDYATQSTPYGSAYTRLYATRGSITTRQTGFTSSYNSLQVVVRRRELRTVAGSFFITGNYTWSKNLDPLTEIFATYSSGAYSSKSMTQWGSIKKFDWGPSDTDRRHMSTISVAWNVKGSKANRVAEIATSGWSLIPVVYAYTGNPLSIYNGLDRDLDGVSVNDRPNISNASAPLNTRAMVIATTGAKSCSTGYYNPNLNTNGVFSTASCVDPKNVHFVQAPTYDPINPTMAHRNSVYAGRYIDMDLSVLKTIRITEGTKFELRGEFFNFTNTQSWDTGNVAATVYSTSSSSNRFLDWSQTSGGNRTFRVGGKLVF